MARLTLALTLFLVLAVCALVTTDAKRRRGKGILSGRVKGKMAVMKKSQEALENQLVKGMKKGNRTGLFSFFFKIINKVLEVVGIKKKTEKPKPPAPRTTPGVMTGTTQTAGTPGTTQTPGTPGTTETAGTQGTTETAGTQGTTETAGTQGTTETAGIQGTTETTGTQGTTETAGTLGTTETQTTQTAVTETPTTQTPTTQTATTETATTQMATTQIVTARPP